MSGAVERRANAMRRALAESTIVWLVGARPLLRSGLRAQFDNEGFEIAAEAGSVEEILQSGLDGLAPDLIIFGNTLGADALVTLKALQPQAHVVVIAESAEISHLADMFGAGADGYLLKSISPNALVESLRLVDLGEKVFPSILTDFLDAMRAAQGGSQERWRIGDVALSQREFEIIRTLAEGHSNKVIAHKLTISETTVKVHMKAVLRKLGATNRTQVAIWAMQHGVTNGIANAQNGGLTSAKSSTAA
jgi:two-component system nitrate/nitrite response regulator NarL